MSLNIRGSRSIRQLILVGFLVVVLPLMVALISTVFQVDRLTVVMQKNLRDSALAVEYSRLITAQAFSMERSAEQYGVLRDPDLLKRYQTQRVQLAEAISRLSSLSLSQAISSQLKKLDQGESSLHGQLLQWAEKAGTETQKLDAKFKLAELVRPIPQTVTRLVTQKSETTTKQIQRVQRMLLWQTGALIPLALILAGIFSVLISRPLRSLGKAIRLLGAGEFDSPITVSGPQDIRELGQQLDWMRERLAELDQQKMIFLQHVSHELKTPLTAIREGSELLRDGVVGTLNEDQMEVANILRENSLQLQTQVENLLNFNLAWIQDRPVQPGVVDLSKIIHDVISKHKLTMRNRNISLETNINPVELPGEPEQLLTVFDNLLSNAIKYTPDGDKIIIRLDVKNQQACVDVIDQGSGVSAEHKQRIFEPFFQAQQSPEWSLKGTGLGLAIAQRYVRLHKGSIQVLDTQQGAHFRVCLPLHQHGIESENNEL